MYEPSVSVIYGAKVPKKIQFFYVKAARGGDAGGGEAFDQKQIHFPAGEIWVGKVNE